MKIKPETRIIAWDDCAFSFRQRRVRIVGTIFRGGSFLDGMLSTEITKDGFDATEKICSSVLSSRHYDQLSCIMLNGVSFAGFNMVDAKLLSRKTKLPVIVVMRHKPDIKKFKAAMKKLGGYNKRLLALKHAGAVYKYNNIFYQKSQITRRQCEDVFKLTCTRANIPEPLRAAHLIASGLSRTMHAKPNKDGKTLGRKRNGVAKQRPDTFFLGYESRGRA